MTGPTPHPYLVINRTSLRDVPGVSSSDVLMITWLRGDAATRVRDREVERLAARPRRLTATTATAGKRPPAKRSRATVEREQPQRQVRFAAVVVVGRMDRECEGALTEAISLEDDDWARVDLVGVSPRCSR